MGSLCCREANKVCPKTGDDNDNDKEADAPMPTGIIDKDQFHSQPIKTLTMPIKTLQDEETKPARFKPALMLDDLEGCEGARYVDCDMLARDLGQTLVVDVRGPDYAGGHIPDSYRLPFEQILDDSKILHKLYDEVRDLEGRKDKIVFCCMHGEPKSRLCAEKLAASLDEKREAGEDIADIEYVGFLVGGMHGWVNGFVDQQGIVRSNMVMDFDSAAWTAEVDTTGLDTPSQSGTPSQAPGSAVWTHVASKDSQSLVSLGASPKQKSQSLRRAKSLLAQSHAVSLDVIDEVARSHLETYSAHMYQPEDIQLDHDCHLGSGSGGVVIGGTHRPSGAKLAVKMIAVDDSIRRKRLLNSLSLEMSMSGTTAAEGIMQMRSIFVQDEKVFLVMDFMDLGGTRNLMNLQKAFCERTDSKAKGLPEPIVQLLAKQVVTGIHTLHVRKLLHRDVKPDNVLVNTAGIARVADFGISTMLEGDNSCTVELGDGVRFEGHSGVTVHAINADGTYDLKDREGNVEKGVQRSAFEPKKIFRASSFIGTQAYLSPQMAKNSGVSFTEDIWALGIVLYEWSTGEHPFQEQVSSTGEFFGSLWETMAEKEGLFLPECDEGGRPFSAELRDIVKSCLRKRPSERLSAAKLLEHPFVKSADVELCQREWDSWLRQVRDS